MIVKQIRLSNSAKDKLSRLKGKTGINEEEMSNSVCSARQKL